jgi:hypothetical protein
VPSDIAVQSTRVGAEGGKKRHKQCPQGGGGTTTTDYDDGNNGKVVMTAVHSDKRQARSPNDHIKRLLEEACPNHAYPARHKLKDYDMMKSFMISGSPT